jgi:hypothetical protein
MELSGQLYAPDASPSPRARASITHWIGFGNVVCANSKEGEEEEEEEEEEGNKRGRKNRSKIKQEKDV